MDKPNKEFLDYLVVSGVLGEYLNMTYINELIDSESYVGDYYKSLCKYTNKYWVLINTFYWLNRNMPTFVRYVLGGLLDILGYCDKYFGREESKRLLTNFQRTIVVNLYRDNAYRLLKELRIIVNPLGVFIDGKRYSVSKHKYYYSDIDMVSSYEMILRNLENDTLEKDIGFLICKDGKVEKVKMEGNRYPFDTLKDRLEQGLEYDLIGICEVSTNKSEDMLGFQLDKLFGKLDER